MKLKESLKMVLRIVEVFVLVGTFIITLCNSSTITSLQRTNNELASKQASAQQNITQLLDEQNVLQATISQLLGNLTKAQEKIAQLSENQTKIQNPTPTITIELVQTIFIGPPPSSQISVFPDGVISFQYNASLLLNLTVLVSTVHGANLTIPKGALPFFGYNVSNIWIGFSYSGVSAMGYIHAFNPFTTELLSISMPFHMYYEFTNSHILQETQYDLGYIGFSLSFTDLYTHLTYSQSSQALFKWNNSTSMP